MSYVSEILSDSPAAYYRCQEASGLLQDSSGNGRHTTVSAGNAPTYQQPSALASDPSDYSIRFNQSWFTAPDSGFDFGDTWTLECWVKRTTTGVLEHLIAKGTNAYEYGIEAADTILSAQAAVANIRRSSSTITDTRWHHVVATKDGSNAFIYIDGVDVSVFIGDPTTTDSAVVLYIGQSPFGGADNQSFLDEIAVYPTALSSTRILAHYAAAIGPTLRSQYLDYDYSR